ncbi:MAG: hypothetical protein H8D26_03495 [Methanomicrobia archaeon]|nr:hypothetical protein [Methanomicrobia archaeon]
MPALGKTRVTVDVGDKLYEEFKIVCIKKKKSMSYVLRKCMQRYVEEHQRAKIVS